MGFQTLEQLKENLKDKPLAKIIGRHAGLMRKAVKIYKVSCPSCRNIIHGDPTALDLDKFCHDCRKKIKPILYDMFERINETEK